MKKRLGRTDRGFVLAEGEVTGHYHSIDEDIEMYEDDGVKFMSTFTPVTIRHQEHKPLTIETPGEFTVGIVRELDHIQEKIREVKD